MKQIWLQNMAPALRGFIPFVFALLLVLISVAPWRFPGFGTITPFFLLMAVFYWSVYRPDRLPYAATFLLGLVQDVLSGNPMGLTPLVLLLVQGMVISQRRFFVGKSFMVVWWGFMLVAVVAALVGWSIGSVFFGTAMVVSPLGVQVVLTVLLYPPLAWLFGRAQQLSTHAA